MKTLILVLPPQPPGDAPGLNYLCLDQPGSGGRHGRAAIDELPAASSSTEVVVVVPLAQLSFHAVSWPPGLPYTRHKPAPRLRQALQGLLEEHLLAEPEDLHLALQPTQGEGPVWVAACERAWLQAWMHCLDSAGLAVARIVPERAPGMTPGLARISGTAEAPWLSAAAADGGVLCLPGSSAALQWLAPERLQATPAVFEAAQRLAPAELPLVMVDLAEDLAPALASDWDLAQQEFVRSGQARLLRRLRQAWALLCSDLRWRPVRWAGLVGAGALLLGINLLAWQERSGLREQQQQVRQLLVSTFPNQSVVLDAPLQMQRAVQQLRHQAGVPGREDLEPLLAVAGRMLDSQLPADIEYTGSSLVLRGLNIDPQRVKAWTERLIGSGYGLEAGDKQVEIHNEI